MAVHMLPDTAEALGAQAARCESRSLYQDRFADPAATDKTTPTRMSWFEGLSRKKPHAVDRAGWLPSGAAIFHARLKSRLMVNMAGGVMENAGLCLDRHGMPHIPGDPIKACARRMALQALHDWVAAGTERPAEEDVCAPCCEGFANPTEMLAEIALVFGWVDQDWSGEKKREKVNGKIQETTWQSDFAWALSGEWAGDPDGGDDDKDTKVRVSALLKSAATILLGRFGLQPKPSHEDHPWKSLPNFAGTVAFLPAYPNADPGIDLDVVTCHHREYYEGRLKVAADNEDPNPVLFPAVRSQEGTESYFTFALLPLSRCGVSARELPALARRWLVEGLGTFGIGAKTNAGYGWFDAWDALNREIDETKAVRALENEFRDFSKWSEEQREDAILLLSERGKDCRVWRQRSPESFSIILAFADNLGIPLE